MRALGRSGPVASGAVCAPSSVVHPSLRRLPHALAQRRAPRPARPAAPRPRAPRTQPRAAAPHAAAAAAAAAPFDAASAAARLAAPHTPEEAALIESLLRRSADDLAAEARRIRDQGHPRVMTFSPKVFIPLTRLCRDACGYCTFARPPVPGRRAYMTIDEVLEVARLGAAQGCCEALFTLGDKPEDLYPEARSELSAMGFESTLDYVRAAAAAVLRETGLLPHINAGVMGADDFARLKDVSASQGLMLESLAPALLAPGAPHDAPACPDKAPGARLAALAAAGAARASFTTGILIGIGESRRERLEALLVIKRLQDEYGHIQEVIVQNFRAKAGTPMAAHPEPTLDDLVWAVAAARIILGPSMSIQAPPNLTPAGGGDGGGGGDLEVGWRALIDAGINDWGGISPVTRDFVNPERPWPHLAPLAAACAAAGKLLLPRLPVYPAYITDEWLSHRAPPGDAGGVTSDAGGGGGGGLGGGGAGASVGARARRAADGCGLLRAHEWCAGTGPGGGEAAEAAGATGGVAETPNGGASGSTSGSSSARGAAAPRPRPRGGGAWRIALSDDGTLEGMPSPSDPSDQITDILDRVLSGARAGGSGRDSDHSGGVTSGSNHDSGGGGGGGAALSECEVAVLLRARGADMAAVVAAADALRRRVCGDEVTYVVNRNINYTNVCTYACSFCAFSKGKASEDLRGAPYLVPLEEISRRTAEAWDRGATEVCMQGGIHPDFTGETYLRILRAAKEGAPDIHVHAFSPLEVTQGARTLGLPLREYLGLLKSAGLGSLPGTAAEVLDANVRSVICPDKITASEWIEVIRSAHEVGLDTTSTIMFGHVEVDGPAAWARHLVAVREAAAAAGAARAAWGRRRRRRQGRQQQGQQGQHQQEGREEEEEGGGGGGPPGRITEFVPLPFVHMQAPVYLKGGARRGPTLRECVLMHAVARLALHPHVTNIQASWVKMGPERAAALLAAGCNDMGGSIMNESITRAAGASFGQELPPERMEALICAAGRVPRQRTTRYGPPPPAQAARAFGAPPLAPAESRRAGGGAAL